jgi:hypothetical protein
MEFTTQNNVQVTVDIIYKLWPFVLAILGVIWKQISDHFEQKELKVKCSYLDQKVTELQKEFSSDLKEHILQNRDMNKEMSIAITELIRSTSVIAAKLDMNLSEFKSSNKKL